MSESASIGPLINNIMEFLAALGDLRRATAKAESLKTSDGQTHRVEAVFEDGIGRKAGLQKTEKGYRVVADCHGLSAEQVKKQSESIQAVVQRYSYRKVVKQLQAEGYAVAEEQKQADGSIRLVARKWVS